ncbi:Rossmann-fold NAD(P)-binding domain-containing protein [Robbsia andropogonis]|uniref:hypothetical protein n=1 Tax=Robbsia andropogonis TaxID=28092 RepID=UPI0004657F4D|nr:hypothetical protein [Robbsia andropogonis]
MKYGNGHNAQAILLIGALSELGHGMAAERVKKAWHVAGTTRPVGDRTTPHDDLAEQNPGRVDVETVDLFEHEQITALHARLSGKPGLVYRDPIIHTLPW